MKLEEAWMKIKEMERVDLFSSKEIYNILSDFGVFHKSPRLQIILKTALQNGLWDIITKSQFEYSSIENLRNRLIFFGFSDYSIEHLFSSCGIRQYSHQNHTVHEQEIYPSNESGSHSSKELMHTNVSSVEDNNVKIENNSLFIVDEESFAKYKLTLQSLGSLQVKQEGSNYHVKLSYEITGCKSSKACSLDLRIFDLENNLREVIKIDNVKVFDEFSICSNTISAISKLPAKQTSKIVLGCGYPRFAYDSHPDSYTAIINEPIVKRFYGKIEFQLEKIIINDIQIIGGDNTNSEISFFIDYKYQQKTKFEYPSKRIILAAVYDQQGKLRQQCCVKLLCYSHQTDNHFNFSARHTSHLSDSYDNSLKIPFDSISKIVIFDKYTI